jgi:hypothetical protein
MSFEQFQVQEDGDSGLGIMPNNMAYGASNSGMEMQGVPGCMRLVEGDLDRLTGIFDDSFQQVGQMRPRSVDLKIYTDCAADAEARPNYADASGSAGGPAMSR